MITTVKDLKKILNNFDDNKEIFVDDEYIDCYYGINKLEINVVGDVIIKLKDL